MNENKFFELTNVKGAHYVPKSVLKHFTHNGTQLHAYDAQHDKYLLQSIKNACTKHKLYDYRNEPHSLENMYSELESKIAPIIEKIDLNGYEYELNIDETRWLLIYRIIQVTRSNSAFQSFAEFQKKNL